MRLFTNMLFSLDICMLHVLIFIVNRFNKLNLLPVGLTLNSQLKLYQFFMKQEEAIF